MRVCRTEHGTLHPRLEGNGDISVAAITNGNKLRAVLMQRGRKEEWTISGRHVPRKMRKAATHICRRCSLCFGYDQL